MGNKLLQGASKYTPRSTSQRLLARHGGGGEPSIISFWGATCHQRKGRCSQLCHSATAIWTGLMPSPRLLFCRTWRKFTGRHDEGQQDRESPRRKSSSERALRGPLRGSLCDLVFITSVPLEGPLRHPLGRRFSAFGDSRSCCPSSCCPLRTLQGTGHVVYNSRMGRWFFLVGNLPTP